MGGVHKIQIFIREKLEEFLRFFLRLLYAFLVFLTCFKIAGPTRRIHLQVGVHNLRFFYKRFTIGILTKPLKS